MTELPPDAVAQRTAEVAAWHDEHKSDLDNLLKKVEERLTAQMRGSAPEAKAVVSGRVKTKDSLVTKATKPHKFKAGEFKYTDFLSDIEDIVAVRVLVPMTQELSKIHALIEDSWKFTANGALRQHDGDGDQTRPGYRSTHGILDASDLGGPVTRVEIQLRTILQHAWAELSHDLLYKPGGSKRDDLERRLHAVAGMLELADREFLEIRSARLGLEGINGPVNLDGVRKLATSLFTPENEEDHTDETWYSILTERVRALGHDQMSQLQDQLGDALVRDAQTLRQRIKIDFAWTNPAFLLDVWVRHASGNSAAAEYDYSYFTTQPDDREATDD